MTPSLHPDDDMTLQAYCDGELDAAATTEFGRRLASDEKLRRQRDGVVALRTRLHELADDPVPDDLATRISSSVGVLRPRRPRWSWRTLAACLLIGGLIGTTTTLLVTRDQARDEMAGVLVGNHIRSLLAAQPFDVASSDRHTVKPWFAARLPQSPKVADLSAAGFVLAGGRVDVVGRTPVATIVYRHAAHIVSVTALPADARIADLTVAGYHMRSWRDGDFTYVAVSDLPEADLRAFARAFVTEARQL
jgi:anti-sigma factor RsiW